MTVVGKKRLNLIGRVAMLCAWLLAASCVAIAQSGSNPPPSVPRPIPDTKRDGDVDFSTREHDVRTRMLLKQQKKDYEEHVARAKEARQIAADLRQAFEPKQSFNSEERKRLERLEKLAKRIRNQAGGSDSDIDPKDLPRTIDLAVAALAEIADELCKEVESTPRRIVSTSIIDQANKLIGVIQYVRDTTR